MLRTLFWSEAPTTSPGPVRPRRLGSQISRGQKIARRGGANAKKSGPRSGGGQTACSTAAPSSLDLGGGLRAVTQRPVLKGSRRIRNARRIRGCPEP